MREALQRAWLRRGPLAWLLWPVSVVFGLLSGLRRALYRAGLLPGQRPSVPVVVVGNVVAGGAGKTPVVMALVEHLRARGLRVGVVSRGHGRRTQDCRAVLQASTAAEVGDEPLLIARRCGVPVFVARRRLEAVSALLQAHPGTQLVVSDDGLQHYALQRDLEVCVFDDRGLGNGWLLPAGPLREPWPRRADLVLRTDATPGVEGFVVRRRLADFACRADGSRVELSSLQAQPLNAIAGIARPEAFFAMLRAAGLPLASTQALPDHYDFDSYTRPARAGHSLICTEKDAVKLWPRAPDAWAVALLVDIEPGFWRSLDSLLAPKLSSRT
jgi:tetraacyldisaccharide 4'-kinase